jgi:N-acetylglucosaminyldiphosphoundecaprenol N-acetyl-beta-D-mannosaminyltransferase
MEKVDIAGLKVNSITKPDLLKALLERIQKNTKTFVITPYSEFLYRAFQDRKILDILNQADFAVPDGIGIFWAKKYLEIPLTFKSYWGKIIQAAWQIKYSLAAILFYPKWIKSALPEKIVGADLVWDLAKLAVDNNLSIYLLGGFGQTSAITANKLRAGLIKNLEFNKPSNLALNDGRQFNGDLKIAGASNKNPEDVSVIDDINKSGADILMVAYGPIKQEEWIVKHLPNLNIKLAIGVGGSFDYIAGIKKAPPKFIRYSGLEWLWRLITQPQRLKRIWQATFGLMSGLWHYKVFHSLPLRPNVAIVILNKENKVLICQRNPLDSNIDIISSKKNLSSKDYWQFPQGGIDQGEDVTTAALREAMEETGLINLSLIKVSNKHHTYFWNNALRKFLKNKFHRNCGQKQSIVFLKNLGSDSDVKIDNHEFINYQWVTQNLLENMVHYERSNLTKLVLEDLKNVV